MRSPGYSAPGGSVGQWVAALIGFGLVLVGPAWAERTPTTGELDARVRSVPYEADQIVRLTGQVGFELELVFESGEHFAGLASGDLAGVDFIAQDEHLFLKPRAAGVATNLTVLTDRRVYRFAYVITDGSSQNARGPAREGAVAPSPGSGKVPAAGVPSAGLPPAGALWSVRFVYPPKPELAREGTAVPQVLNERYQFCGARQLKPQRVFDDGVRTTIEFGASQELPAVFVRNPDGSESLVNLTTVGTALVVHRVVEHLVLRRGSLTACLWNRGAARPADGSAAHRSPDEGARPADGSSKEGGRPLTGTAEHRGGVEREVPPAGAAGQVPAAGAGLGGEGS